MPIHFRVQNGFTVHQIIDFKLIRNLLLFYKQRTEYFTQVKFVARPMVDMTML